MINIGIIGGSGYAAGELIRILLHHPDAELRWVSSRSCAGRRIDDVHPGLVGECDMKFISSTPLEKIDVLFCCLPYGQSREFLESHGIPKDLKIIDLARDYRYSNGEDSSPSNLPSFIYGLPELNRKAMVRGGQYVAGPGCIAMVVSLMLLPLARNLLLNSDVHVTAVTGATCSGAERRPTSHYAWRNDNVVVYRPFSHHQLPEINKTLKEAQSSFKSEICLVPIRGPFSRGILAAAYLDCKTSIEQLIKIYEDYYDDHNFTFIVDRMPDLKDVVNTNKCLIHLERIGDRLLITAAIDNLLKGGAGTAVHNMNLLFGLQELTGLTMKAVAF